MTNQFFLTPAEGKRLIAKAIVARPDVQEAVTNHRVLIVAGSTNSYLAEEILQFINNDQEFDKNNFFRGLVKPSSVKKVKEDFVGDVFIEKGKWIKGKSVFESASELGSSDIVFKGANAVYLPTHEAAVLVASPTVGTVWPVNQAVIGKRTTFIVPVGVEKRVEMPITDLARLCNASDSRGLHFCPTFGKAFTELDAIKKLTGLQANILASGGVAGYEGGCYFIVEGTEEELNICEKVMKTVIGEPAYTI